MKKTILAAALAAAALAAPAATPAETAALAAAKQFYAAKGGDFAAAWNALPASYQTEIVEVVKLFASKIDADLWTGAQGALTSLAGAALKKSEFALESVDESDRPDVVRMIAKAAAVAKAATFEDIKAGNVAKVLAAEPLKMPGVTDALPAFKMPELVAKANDDGTVGISDGDDEETFALVNGKWLPKDLSDGFEDGMKEAKENLATFEIPAAMKPQLAMLFPTVTAAAKKAAKAKSKEEFDQSLMQAAMPFMMMAMTMQGAGGADADEPAEFDLAE